MSGIAQTIRNFFIRLVAFSVLGFNNSLRFLQQLGRFLQSFLGLRQSDYFLNTDEAQSTKRITEKQIIEERQKTQIEVPSNNRRKKPKIDQYFLDMARDVKQNK